MVFIFNENEMTMVALYHKNFNTCCVLKLMILLIFVLYGCFFHVFVAVLVSSRGGFLVFIFNENEMTMVASYHKTLIRPVC